MRETKKINRFDVNDLNERGIDQLKMIQQAFVTLEQVIEGSIDQSLICEHMTRAKEIALTKLEAACFFAKKSAAVQQRNHKKVEK